MMLETFDTVDKNDQVLRKGLSKSQLNTNRDITRVVTVHVCDDTGTFYIAQRSQSKSIDPLKFEAAAHGRVSSGEDYKVAAKREVFEEIGVADIELQEIAHYYLSFDTNVGVRQHYKKLYIGKCKKLGKIDSGEVESIKSFVSLTELLEFYRDNTELFSDAMRHDILYLEKYILTKYPGNFIK